MQREREIYLNVGTRGCEIPYPCRVDFRLLRYCTNECETVTSLLVLPRKRRSAISKKSFLLSNKRQRSGVKTDERLILTCMTEHIDTITLPTTPTLLQLPYENATVETAKINTSLRDLVLREYVRPTGDIMTWK